MNRRGFLQKTSTAAIGFSMIRFYPEKVQNPLVENIGLQLYTLRNVLPADPMATLQAIQQAGYKQVELMDVNSLSKLHPVLQSMDLSVNSSHFLSPYITGNWDPLASFGMELPKEKEFEHVVDLAVQHELEFLVFPFLFPQERGGLDMYKSLSEKLNRAGELCKDAGIRLCYHNHSFEFQPMEDSSPFQVMYQELEPDLVNFEIDIFWVSVAGFDPATFVREHKERISMLHLKDKKEGTEQSYKAISMPKDSFQPVGAGVLDFKEILKAASEANVVHAFVEQDESSDPLADVKQSIQHLKKLDV